LTDRGTGITVRHAATAAHDRRASIFGLERDGPLFAYQRAVDRVLG
jgi:hypothetical protein